MFFGVCFNLVVSVGYGCGVSLGVVLRAGRGACVGAGVGQVCMLLHELVLVWILI